MAAIYDGSFGVATVLFGLFKRIFYNDLFFIAKNGNIS